MNELGEFLSEEELCRAEPVQRGVLYWVDASSPDSTPVEVIFVDDAADAFPSEGVEIESADTSGLVGGMAAFVAPPPPRITRGVAVAAVALGTGVLAAFSVVLWLLPPNQLNRAT